MNGKYGRPFTGYSVDAALALPPPLLQIISMPTPLPPKHKKPADTPGKHPKTASGLLKWTQ
jgi:hypothetical protein